MIQNEKWDRRFLKLAEHVAQWSKDPSTKIGAVIVDKNNRVLSLGYNGFPVGVDDDPKRYEDRETKYKMITHGEVNSLLFAQQTVAGCTIYTWPLMPCAQCAGMIIQSGVQTVVSIVNDNPRWQAAFETSKLMFKEAGLFLLLYTDEGVWVDEGIRGDNPSFIPSLGGGCG